LISVVPEVPPWHKPSLSPRMNLRHYLGSLRRTALCVFYRRGVPLGDRGPIVSFTFDDFPRSALSVGGSILEEFGARGTYYVSPGLINSTNELGEQFHADDLHCLLEEGHELGHQTFGHISGRAVSCSAFLEDVRKGRMALEELTGMDATNFAYPYGHATVRTKRALGPTLTSCRSIIPGFNGPDVDLNLLKANRLYGDIDLSSAAEKLILENAEERGWLVFYTHDVRPDPSRFGCTPALLRSAVSFAKRSGSRILTVQEVLAEVGAQNGHPKGQVQGG